jgi:hypothetical protein
VCCRPSSGHYRVRTDFTTLPGGLPVPEDDGAAAHLPGAALPALTLAASDGSRVDLGELYRRLTLVVTGGRIEHVFYPVFPPSTHAQEVLDRVRRAGY